MRALAVVAAVLLTYSTNAEAHFQLVSPPSVGGDANGKGAPPCGPDTGRAATPTPVQGGHPLKISVFETVGHMGFYRVALAIKSRAEFPVDNVVYDAGGRVLPPNGMPMGTSARADTQKQPKFPVLADDFYHHDTQVSGQTFNTDSVNIPNINCDRCTLQVIEFMYPHGFNAGGGYFYHHCAEIKITADPALPIFGADGSAPPEAPTTDGGGVSATDAGQAGTGGTGGSSGTGGNTGTGGSGATGGQAGAAPSGVAGTGGTAPTGGGVSGTGGTAPTGPSGSAGMAGPSTTSGGEKSGGGFCSIGGSREQRPVFALALFGAVGALLTRARRRR